MELNSPAIKALGSLFKLTEVHLWDVGFPTDDPKPMLPKHIRFKYDDDDDDDKDCGGYGDSGGGKNKEDNIRVVKDEGFTDEMSALGLPLSFKTSKQKRGAQVKDKITAVQRKNQKNQKSQKRPDERVEESYNVNEGRPCLADFLVKTSNPSPVSSSDQSKHFSGGSGTIGDTVGLSNFYEKHDLVDMAPGLTCNGLEEHVHDSAPQKISTEALYDDLVREDLHMQTEAMASDNGFNFSVAKTSSGSCTFVDLLEEHQKERGISLTGQVDTQDVNLDRSKKLPENFGSSIIIQQQPQVSHMSNDSQNVMVLDQAYSDSVRCCGSFGDWSAYWDSFYIRYYFYNSLTKESTWYAPPGMESFASGDSCCTVSESNAGVPGTDACSPVHQSDEVQSESNELVDKANASGGGELAASNVSSGTATLCESTYILNSTESCVLDDQCRDEMALKSLLNTVEDSHNSEPEMKQADSDMNNGLLQSSDSVVENSYNSEPEMKQADSGDMNNGHLQSTDFVGSPYENSDRNCYSNITAQVSNASSSTSAVEATCDDDVINNLHFDEEDSVAVDLHMLDTSAGTKKKTRRKHRRRTRSFNSSEVNELYHAEESYVDITKYWCQRYLLFSRFDDGIKMDEEGWFSVTPEAIARHQASRSGGGTVIDCFTGVGGNAIQFAKTSKHVIAIDIDPKKIDYARHNAAVYGVEDRIDFIKGDSLSLVSKLNTDAVFLSPPWGGPDYVKVKCYDIDMLQPYDGHFLFDTFKEIASIIIMFLPRNVDIVQLAELSLSTNPPWSLEVEKNFLNGKFKAVTAYFSRTLV